MAQIIATQNNVLQHPREELLEESEEVGVTKRTKCYVANILIGGVLTTALIDTGAEVTCLSEEFVNENKGRLQVCPTLPVNGVTLVGPMGGKAIRLKEQIYADVQLPNHLIQVVFLVVPKLSRPCIIGIDLLDEFRSQIDLDNKIISFPLLEGKPSIRIMNEETTKPPKKETRIINSISKLGNNVEVSKEEIRTKIQETNLINSNEKKQLEDLLWKHKAVFRKTPGRLTTYQHRLLVKENQAFIGKSYPVPIAYRDKVDQEIKRMLEMGIIQRSSSPYINPIVPVIKKDGTVRLCLDARKLNDILLEDWECPEPAEILFQRCKGIKVMSSLDMTSSFWQVPLEENSKQYTAFQYRGKSYEFNVVPFGLKTSTAALVRGLDKALQGIGNHIISFVDDTLVTSESVQQHLEHIEELLTRLEKNNLTLNLNKSNFFKKETKFLGFIITTEGIKPDPDKVQGITDFPTPKNVKQLRGFLGLVNFYSKFSSKHAEETVPLLHLIKKGVPWKWDENMQGHFNRVKQLFSKSITLYFPDPKKSYYLETDASNYALGAILYQKNQRQEKEIITLASRTLKGPELSYFTTEKELLAIVWALQKFRTYLQGAHIINRTDHMALTFLKTCKFTNARLTRWILAIQDYDITIEHCPGKENIAADLLSRQHPEKDWEKGRDITQITINALKYEWPSELENDLKNIQILQREDMRVNRIIQTLEKDTKQASRFSINKGILCQKSIEGERIYLPIKTLKKLIWECHVAYGHTGADKNYKIIKEHFYYPRLAKIIRQILSTCDSCQRNKITTKSSSFILESVQPGEPLELLSIDFFGPLVKTKYGYEYILVVMDTFTKYTKLYPLRKATSKATIRKIDDFIKNIGKPQKILTDQGTQFTSNKWKEALKEREIKLILTSIRHPQANMVERVNRELARFFRTFLPVDRHESWYNWIEEIETILNESYHDTIEITPHEALLGTKPKRIWEEWIPQMEYKRSQNSQTELTRIIREKIKTKGERRNTRINKDKIALTFEPGDLVLVKACNVANAAAGKVAKFLSLYEGPYKVKKRIARNTYILSSTETERERGQFHAVDLKLYRTDPH